MGESNVEDEGEQPMETESLPPSWFEFLLYPGSLERHLRQESPDPSPSTLLAQFIINTDRCTIESASATPIQTPPDVATSSSDEGLYSTYRQRKTRALRLICLQTFAFMSWDLDVLTQQLSLNNQLSLMKHVLAMAEEESTKEAEIPLESVEFLRILYNRWVVKTLQSHKSFTKTARYANPADQYLLKQLNEDEAVNYLQASFTKPELAGMTKICVPSSKAFDVDYTPKWNEGTEIERVLFDSMIHLDLGVFLLYKGDTPEAISHFKLQRIPLENFPFLKISKAKLEGYLRAVGLLSTFDQTLEDNKILTRNLDYDRLVEVTISVKKGQTVKLKKMKGFTIDSLSTRPADKLNFDKKDKEDGTYAIPGDDTLTRFSIEKRLIETTNAVEIKELLMKLHGPIAHQTSATPRMFYKLFSSWELPIPVQNATLNIPNGPFQDYIYILVAKSRQLLQCKVYSDARKMLETARGEIQLQLQQSVQGGMTPHLYNLGRLAKMMEWEVLLIDINEFTKEYPTSLEKKGFEDLKSRCKECLMSLQNVNSDVNPRSEIVENILVTFINLGEYSYVANFDQMQNQRWPFVEFISLLARVCQDLFNGKDTSSNYRELWSAVLPIFSNGQGTAKKPGGISSKPAILSSRSALTWIIERSCSQLLLSVWVSLLARLHNHILDDVGLQIHTDHLQIWPNILDDVTSTSVIAELKSNRVSGSSKLNSKHIRDFLFSLLERGIKLNSPTSLSALRCLGDVHLASSDPSSAMKCYLEYLALCTDYFEKHHVPQWGDAMLFKRMIKCCELLGCFTQAVVLCQFLPDVDYSMAFGMAQEKMTNDSSDSLYGFVWDLTILEFLVNLHAKRNEVSKRLQSIRVMGLLELNANNNEEIQREAMYLRKSQFMRSLVKHYIFM